MRYNKFYFESYRFTLDTLTATFCYHFDSELFFEETISFQALGYDLRKGVDQSVVESMLFHVHLALGISYYKFYPVDTFVVNATLTDEQLDFWNTFYSQGLGEFFYTNHLPPYQKVFWEFKHPSHFRSPIFETSSRKSLVPIGGGKDSIVTIELLKKHQKNFDLVTLATKDSPLYQNTQDVSGKMRLFFQRTLSPNIPQVLSNGAYNGHVPVTGMIAFVLLVVAYLYDYEYIIMSNEFSASFGNTLWQGMPINHQWSKSFEFEVLFSKYVKSSISQSCHYFSLLRPWYEVQIAHLFAHIAKPYFPFFSSCNTNFKVLSSYSKEGFWCNACPKCAFVYAILRPYLTREEVISIFGVELYDLPSLHQVFCELVGFDGIKPFECVGESSEVLFALRQTLPKRSGPLPDFLDLFKNTLMPKVPLDDWKERDNIFLDFSLNAHKIPCDFIKLIEDPL